MIMCHAPPKIVGRSNPCDITRCTDTCPVWVTAPACCLTCGSITDRSSVLTGSFKHWAKETVFLRYLNVFSLICYLVHVSGMKNKDLSRCKRLRQHATEVHLKKHPDISIEWNFNHLLFPAHGSDVRCRFMMAPKVNFWLATCYCCKKGSFENLTTFGEESEPTIVSLFFLFTFWGCWRFFFFSFFHHFAVNRNLKASAEHLTHDSGWQGAPPGMKKLQEPNGGWGRRGSFRKEEEERRRGGDSILTGAQQWFCWVFCSSQLSTVPSTLCCIMFVTGIQHLTLAI